MPTAQDRSEDERYATVLRVAGPVSSLASAFDAEMLVSTLLGSVYSIAQDDRATAVHRFTAGLRTHLAGRGTPDAVALRAVLDGWTRAEGGHATRGSAGAQDRPAGDTTGGADTTAGANGPAGAPTWAGQLAAVSPVDTYAYGDVYGDQVTYVATFRYPDPELGGPEHALVALIDHNLGFIRDLFVTPAADAVLARLAPAAADDPLTWLDRVEPTRLRAEVARHLAHTDALRDLPSEDSLATDRALALARLHLLPADGTDGGDGAASGADGESEPDHPALLAEFLSSREGARLGPARGRAGESLRYCLELIGQFAAGWPEPDPLRWSPALVDLFLLDWVPRRALLDADDIARLPTVLSNWVTWAGRRRGLPPAAVARTVAAVARTRAEFTELSATGARRSPEAAAVARMLAEGVDPADAAAVEEWLEQQAGEAP